MKAQRLLSRYVIGKKKHRFELEYHGHSNLQDLTRNIKMPIFIINGNHDDSAGTYRLSYLDLAS